MIELWNSSVAFRLICLLTPVMVFVIWAFRYILVSHGKIVDEHRAVKKQLLDSDTREAFIAAWQRAIDWQKTTWHKNHSALAMELKGIIDTKKQIYGI